MLAPDPALAGLIASPRATGQPAAPSKGMPVPGQGATADGVASAGTTAVPAFDVLMDAVAAEPAAEVAPGAGALPAGPRGKGPGKVAQADAEVTAGRPGTVPAVLAAPPPALASEPSPDGGPVQQATGVEAAPVSGRSPAIARRADPAQPTAPATEAAEDAAAVAETAAPAAKAGRIARAAEPVRAAPAEAAAPAAAPHAAADMAVQPPAAAAPGWQLAPAPAVGAAHIAPQASPLEVAAAPGVPAKVASQISVAVSRGGASARKVELRLDPPELGRVEIHLAPTDKGTLHATVVAERAETHELLRRHGDALARELGAAGYSDVSLSFSSGSDAPAGRSLPSAPEQPETVMAAVSESGRAIAATAPMPLPVADGGLDIRL